MRIKLKISVVTIKDKSFPKVLKIYKKFRKVGRISIIGSSGTLCNSTHMLANSFNFVRSVQCL